MYTDEIIADVWRHREAYMATHNHDLAAAVKDLMARQKASNRKFVDRRDSTNASAALASSAAEASVMLLTQSDA